MATIVTRSGKGVSLTHNEVDANFTNLNTDKAEVSDVILATEKGAASGVAPLDATSKISSTYLPSYVDDVLEYANYAALPATGETGKIYVALDTNKTYRWSGSAYIYITSGAVDSVAGKTGVVTLTASDVGLGNVTNNAAVANLSGTNTGDQTLPTTLPASDVYAWAKAATKPTYTATEVGLGSVNNTTDVGKPVSTATQTALDLKASLASPTLSNPTYTGTLTGSTGVLNIGSGQVYKDASGNVGIGTTTALTTTANRVYLAIKGTGTAAGNGQGVLQFQTNSAGSTNPNVGNIEWCLPDNSSSSSLRVAYISSQVVGSTANNCGSNMTFATKSDGVSGAGTERMIIDSSGKVGINVVPVAGTNAKLQITGLATNATTLATAYSNASLVVVPKSTSGYSLAIASGTGDFPQLQVSANGAASGDLLIQPYGGNVGIGATSNLASSKLDVRGRIRLGSGTSAGDSELTFSNYASATSAWNVAVRQDIGGANNDLKFLRFDSAGNYQAIAMQISSAGGIVTMPAYGAGAATFSAAGVISSVSDETWKIKDGAPNNPDEMLQKLKPGYWFYNEEKAPIFGAERQLGFYAQNVNEAIGVEAAPIPETFTELDENGIEVIKTKPWGYYDRSVLAVAVMSLQKALTTIEALTARLTALEAK